MSAGATRAPRGAARLRDRRDARRGRLEHRLPADRVQGDERAAREAQKLLDLPPVRPQCQAHSVWHAQRQNSVVPHVCAASACVPAPLRTTRQVSANARRHRSERAGRCAATAWCSTATRTTAAAARSSTARSTARRPTCKLRRAASLRLVCPRSARRCERARVLRSPRQATCRRGVRGCTSAGRSGGGPGNFLDAGGTGNSECTCGALWCGRGGCAAAGGQPARACIAGAGCELRIAI
jgi:hypothetical protein